MKELLEFIKSNNGVLYYDKEHSCFVIASELDVSIVEGTNHCTFKGCNIFGTIPDNAFKEWVQPAIKAIKRLVK